MGNKVELSENSQKLINEFLIVYGSDFNNLNSLGSPVDSATLINWLATDINVPEWYSKHDKEKIEFMLASLRAELLSDLLTSMQGSGEQNKKTEESTSFSNKLKFILLAIAGTLLAACEGFDSIASLMSVLSFSALSILAVGLVFSALSVVVFYGFDLVQVSQNLGVKLKDAPKLLDVYLSQMDEIKAIRRTIESYHLAKMSAQELESYELTITMLQKRLKAVSEASKQFENAINSEQMKVAETAVSWVAGLLFFGSGFFAGQSVAIFVLSLFMATVAPTFLPVVLFGLGIGVAAFCLYWNVERVGVKKLISTWFGLDEEKIEKLCDSEQLAKAERKLDNLQEHILSTKNLINKVSTLKETNVNEENKPEDITVKEPTSLATHNPAIKTSNNIYSFHTNSSDQKSSHSQLDLDDVPAYSCS